MRGIASSLISVLAFLSGGASAAPIQWTVESAGMGIGMTRSICLRR